MLIQQLMDPSMAVWPSSTGWLHTLGPQSGSRLGESWGETGASTSQALTSEHTGAHRQPCSGALGARAPKTLGTPPRGAVGGFAGHCCSVQGCAGRRHRCVGRCTPAMVVLVPVRAAAHPPSAPSHRLPVPTPRPPHARPALTCGHQPGQEAAEPQEQEQRQQPHGAGRTA